MNESSDGRFRLVGFILILAIVVGVWYFISRSSTKEAIDETVDVFVPGPEEFNRRTSHIHEARRVTDLINDRQARALEQPE